MYDYAKEKKELFSDEGQRMFLKVRDKANSLLKTAGAFRSQEAWSGCTGSNWTIMGR